MTLVYASHAFSLVDFLQHDFARTASASRTTVTECVDDEQCLDGEICFPGDRLCRKSRLPNQTAWGKTEFVNIEYFKRLHATARGTI